jgi:hypothetical protein
MSIIGDSSMSEYAELLEPISKLRLRVDGL